MTATVVATSGQVTERAFGEEDARAGLFACAVVLFPARRRRRRWWRVQAFRVHEEAGRRVRLGALVTAEGPAERRDVDGGWEGAGDKVVTPPLALPAFRTHTLPAQSTHPPRNARGGRVALDCHVACAKPASWDLAPNERRGVNDGRASRRRTATRGRQLPRPDTNQPAPSWQCATGFMYQGDRFMCLYVCFGCVCRRSLFQTEAAGPGPGSVPLFR